MDPYAVLGVSADASQKEIKKAYRREAMKWHPDRCDNSAEAKERFHQAAIAYKILSGRDASGKGGNGEWRSETYREEEPDSTHDPAGDSAGSEDNSADTVFWDVMLDYAIKLAQTGLRENAIKFRLVQKGCPKRLAAVIAEKGYDIHAHYVTGKGYATGKGKKKREREPDQSSFKQERLEAELFRAFIGGGNVLFSPRDTIDYYLVAFGELRQCAKLNPLTWISANPRLMRILNFSIVLFAVITVAIGFFPGPSEYKLLPDMGMLQVPLGLLALMFVWAMYRKLWF
ncbi:MAG: DnaJ domain-containing protein, partial [Gammaproteobacteria bacterium]